MTTTPFLVGFARKTKAVQVDGRYDRKTQTLMIDDRALGNVSATMPTHIETGTGGHNDTDTDAVED